MGNWFGARTNLIKLSRCYEIKIELNLISELFLLHAGRYPFACLYGRVGGFNFGMIPGWWIACRERWKGSKFPTEIIFVPVTYYVFFHQQLPTWKCSLRKPVFIFYMINLICFIITSRIEWRIHAQLINKSRFAESSMFPLLRFSPFPQSLITNCVNISRKPTEYAYFRPPTSQSMNVAPNNVNYKYAFTSATPVIWQPFSRI